MEFVFILALVAVIGRKYKNSVGVKPTMLNPNLYREEGVFMVMFNLVMKERRIQ